MILFSSLFLYFYSISGGIDARLDILTQIEKQLIEIVQDDAREAKAFDVIEQMKVTVQKQHDDYYMIQSDFLKVSANYHAESQRYNELDKKVDAFWQSTMKQQVGLRFALREQLTREEWNRLYKEIN